MRSSVLRSRIAAVVREVAAKYAEEMILIEVGIARDVNVNDDVRLRAANCVLDRAAGKPAQEMIFEGADGEEFRQRFIAARDAATQLNGSVGKLPPPTEQPITDADFVEVKPRRRLKLKPDA